MIIGIETRATISCCNVACRHTLTVVGGAYLKPSDVESMIRSRMAEEGWAEVDIGRFTPLPEDWPEDRRNLSPTCKACLHRAGMASKKGVPPKASARKAKVRA